MSKRTDAQLLEDILESMGRIASYVEGLSYDDFRSDPKTQDAVVRNLEIIGEAAKKISQSTKDSFPDVPWKEMAGTWIVWFTTTLE